ncbi:EamA family transporter [Sulfitobacter aestuariivivens]
MVLAGLGWAAYTIIGKRSADPLAATAANFLLCLPIVVVMLLGAGGTISNTGVALGILCGGVTSGLGYALWYTVLPKLEGATAAIVQLSVPILAIVAGVLFLDEPLSLLLVLSAAMVVGGIAWAITARSVRADHN